MKNINNKGFMIAELLIVTVAIMVIFTAIYSNFYPMIGEYEKRETYNNINALYANFYLKTLHLKGLSNNASLETSLINKVKSKKYVVLVENGSCTTELSSISGFQTSCNDLVTNLGITDAILTTNDITNLKKSYPATGTLKNYINYLSNVDENNLYRLITKTNDGYATSTFYSKTCAPIIYTPWSDWSLDSCSGDNNVCKTNNIYLKLGDYQTMICDTNNKLCETTTLYKTTGDWTINSCDTSQNNCETTTGYLKQTADGASKYFIPKLSDYTGGCLEGATQNADRYRCGTSQISIYNTKMECENNCGDPESCTLVTFNVCDEYYVYMGSCVCEYMVFYFDENENENENDIKETYETECIENKFTKCIPATLYRTVGTEWLTMCPSGENCETTTGYRLNEICVDPLQNCCNGDEQCESRTGYSQRTAITNTLDLNSPFVSACN